MDKTTTWLVRGASLIVIIFGITYFSKQYIAGREDYYQSLNEYEKAELRCKNFPKISYSDLKKKLENYEIKYILADEKWTFFQVETIRGRKFIIRQDEVLDQDILMDQSLWKDEDKFLEGGEYYDSEMFSIWSYYTSIICK